MSYPFRVGMRVVILNAYNRDGKPIGVIGTVDKAPSKRNRNLYCTAFDGGSQLVCTPFDTPGLDMEGKDRGSFIARPLTDAERETLDNALDPWKLAEEPVMDDRALPDPNSPWPEDINNDPQPDG